MTRYTVFLLQQVYPDQIKILKHKQDDGIYIECWLLNEDKTPHMMLFDGGPFQNELAIDNTIDKLLKIKLEED